MNSAPNLDGVIDLAAAIVEQAIKDYLRGYHHERHHDARTYLEYIGVLERVHQRYGVPQQQEAPTTGSNDAGGPPDRSPTAPSVSPSGRPK